MSDIAIFGGSFDPVHKAHIEIVKSAFKSFDLAKIIFTPSFLAPHKTQHYACAKDRIEMLKIALAGISNVEINCFEIQKGTKIYSYQTLDYFKELYPNDNIFMIIGSDSLVNLSYWKNIDYIAGKYRFIVANRKGILLTPETKFLDKCLFLEKEIDDISSTQIRKLICSGMDAQEYLDNGVYEYIKKNGLYYSENNNS
ncbi:MAG: nicotinate (nicotinamide) nucleotide adenylyltransferase [Elusimicrobiota bacterium]|nr:nicotinate (nicotinamide) nucleotide adenylyltransferase [Elusimicrobiota bacterium]